MIRDQYARLAQRLGTQPTVSVRSSALGEDSQHSSFAGQYRTRLNVPADAIADAYKEIVASKYQSQAIVYRQQRGYRHQDVLMGVGCLAMVDAVCSGVAYSRSPEDERSPWVVIHAATGLGHHIVDGSAAYDLLHVQLEAPHEVETLHLADPEQPCLTDDQARELARQALLIEDHFGAPPGHRMGPGPQRTSGDPAGASHRRPQQGGLAAPAAGGARPVDERDAAAGGRRDGEPGGGGGDGVQGHLRRGRAELPPGRGAAGGHALSGMGRADQQGRGGDQRVRPVGHPSGHRGAGVRGARPVRPAGRPEAA